jgi:hydrogenase-4 component E
MNGAVIWIVVALGLAVPVVRRRSVAVAAVTAQALVLAAYAAERANGADDILAAAALLARAGLLGILLFVVVRRTRELRPVRAQVGPLVRGASAIGLALLFALLVPSLGLGDRNAERAVLALIAFGLVTVATRRATVLQIVALVQVDNALAVAALGAAGGLPALIELGVAADLIVVVLVAALLHARIYAEFGSGDTAHLGQLRD